MSADNNNVWFNINSIAQLQKNLIYDLSGTNQPEATRTISNIASNLNTLDTVVSSSSVLPTLTYQNDVNRILTREQNRLNERKQIIDNAEMSQKRMIDLTTSATLRNAALNKMYVVITIGLLLYLGIRLLSNFGFVPGIVTDIMVIILVSGIIIVLLNMYSDYERRNNMDYTTINLGEPGKKTDSSSSSSSTSANLLESRLNGCVKEACCPEGSTFNEKYSICVPNFPPNDGGNSSPSFKYFITSKSWLDPVSKCGSADKYSFTELDCKGNTVAGFTTIGLTSDMAKPNSPNEFVDYNLYK